MLKVEKVDINKAAFNIWETFVADVLQKNVINHPNLKELNNILKFAEMIDIDRN